MFCPNDGLKFVGLSEETFLNHIYQKHSTKAARQRPHKLVRSCRICEGTWTTDAELTR